MVGREAKSACFRQCAHQLDRGLVGGMPINDDHFRSGAVKQFAPGREIHQHAVAVFDAGHAGSFPTCGGFGNAAIRIARGFRHIAQAHTARVADQMRDQE